MCKKKFDLPIYHLYTWENDKGNELLGPNRVPTRGATFILTKTPLIPAKIINGMRIKYTSNSLSLFLSLVKANKEEGSNLSLIPEANKE